MDVGQNTTAGDGHTAEELVELLVVADGELDVAGHNAGLLVVAGGVTSKLKDLSSEVLKDGGQVDGGTSTDTGGELALLQKALSDTGNQARLTFLKRPALAALAVDFLPAPLPPFPPFPFPDIFLTVIIDKKL